MARAFNVRFGALTATGRTAVVMALASDDVTLVIDGNTYTISLAAIGADRPSDDASANPRTLGYYGTQVVTLRKRMTQYTWTATQGSESHSGTVYSAPWPGSDFALALTTCFNVRETNPRTQVMGWDFLNAWRKRSGLPLVEILHSDDVIYADSGVVIGSFFDANGKGKATATTYEYDYAFAYAHWFGITGPTVNAAETQGWDAAFHPAFVELMDNVGFMPQWGDHEFENNIGWTGGTALTDVPNPYHATLGGFDGPGLVVYNAVMAPLQGTSAQSADTAANHWYVDIGPVRYISADPITNAVASTSTLGDNQIDDLKGLPTASQWFTILGLTALAGRGPSGGDATEVCVGSSIYSGTSYKNENYIAAEFQRLMLTTGLTPAALMENPLTNGVQGTLVTCRGDAHGMGVWWFDKASGGGLEAEGWYELAMATVNDSFANGGRQVMTTVEVYGSRSPQEVVIKRWEYADQAVAPSPQLNTFTDDDGNSWICSFQRKFQQWNLDSTTPNYGIDTDATGLTLPSITKGPAE